MLYAGLLGAYSGAMECELFSGTKAHQPTLPFLFHKHQNLIFCQTQYQCHRISCAGTSSRTREVYLGSYVSQRLVKLPAGLWWKFCHLVFLLISYEPSLTVIYRVEICMPVVLVSKGWLTILERHFNAIIGFLTTEKLLENYWIIFFSSL